MGLANLLTFVTQHCHLKNSYLRMVNSEFFKWQKYLGVLRKFMFVLGCAHSCPVGRAANVP